MNLGSDYKVSSFVGSDIRDFIEKVGSLRLQTFREFPYLYDGSMDMEKKYIEEYAACKDSVLVGVFYIGKLVGFVTGTPVSEELGIVKDINKFLDEKNWNPASYYYVGEMIVTPEHRSIKTSSKLFKDIETFATEKCFLKTCFMTVMRKDEHPLKPKSYKSLEPLWKFYGYRKTELEATYEWKTFVDGSNSVLQKNKLAVWEKSL